MGKGSGAQGRRFLPGVRMCQAGTGSDLRRRSLPGSSAGAGRAGTADGSAALLHHAIKGEQRGPARSSLAEFGSCCCNGTVATLLMQRS